MIRTRFARPIATLGAATLAAALGTAGLAVAGVNLPDPAADAFERAGISLPNQAGGANNGEHPRSDAVRPVIESTPASERGCEFGHSVAEAAKGSPLPEQAREACERGQGEGNGGGNESNSGKNEFGQETAERARGQRDATVDERRSFGRETSDRAEQLGGAPEGSPAPRQRPATPPSGDATGAPEGTPAPPEGTPQGPPEGAVPESTPTGPPEDLPGRP